jgi:succinate dehydrogenase/fumarate reductase flavoprotein subunit
MNACQSVLFGRGYQIDMLDHLKKSELAVEKAGGYVARATTVTRRLTNDDGDITGLVAEHVDGRIEIACKAIILATGGYQASPELRALYIHPSARNMPLRGNPHSQGDALRLAQSVGGAHAGPNQGFYGHLIAYPVEMKTEYQFVAFSQYHSENAVLLNRQGRRFVDEGRADHESAQMTVREPQGRAVLVWDEKIQRENVMRPLLKGTEPVDRYAFAKQAGANGYKANTIDELLPFFNSIGYDGAACVAGLHDYNSLVEVAPEQLHPKRTINACPMLEGPFYALEVEAAVTVGYAGLSVDTRTRVLDAAGEPIKGLYATGADVGNVYRSGYSGGLAFASTFGFRAAEDFLSIFYRPSAA